MPKSPVRVAVTGAAGQIGYSLLFPMASGEIVGADQPVILQMLEIPAEKAQKALKRVMMELDDCAFPLLHRMVPAPDPMVAFKNAQSHKHTQFTGMLRLDHNRAISKIAQKMKKSVPEIKKVTVWGNLSATQY